MELLNDRRVVVPVEESFIIVSFMLLAMVVNRLSADGW